MSLEHSPAWQGRACYSIRTFCEDHAISRSMFYELINLGIGPRLTKIGKKVLITAEAAADWRREREAASNEAA